jgi:integrase/recombinase XerD
VCNGGHIHSFLAAQKRRNVSAATLAAYRVALRRFAVFMAERRIEALHEVTAEDLEAYRLALVDAAYKPASLQHYMQKLRQFFAWLESEQILFDNPAAALSVPRPDRRLKFVPTEADMQKLLAGPDVATARGIRDRAFIETAYSTGCRLGELIGMSLFDADLNEGLVRVMGKGSKERVVPLGRQAVQWIRQYLGDARPELLRGNLDEPALWVGYIGRRLNPLIAERLIKRYGEDAGIAQPVTPHALRRACATHMLAHGAHPVQIQMLLGHASLRSLGQYLSISIRDLKAAHERSKPGR